MPVVKHLSNARRSLSITEPAKKTSRSCTTASTYAVTDREDDCSSFSILGTEGEVCICFGELCNSAALSSPAFVLTILSVFAAYHAI